MGLAVSSLEGRGEVMAAARGLNRRRCADPALVRRLEHLLNRSTCLSLISFSAAFRTLLYTLRPALYDIPANCCRHALILALSNCITALSFGLLDFHRSAVGTAGFSTSYGTLLLLLYPSLVVLHSNR